ncbi:hypothetical protein OIU85_020685 [Salix viminalis]|uniref:Uncharacterized protein n=1 Tax=Salix viminalis TaxID=40686 RepID=A0A9Q0UGQ0_SALVM|nr:hypothetical protein OIU85_020685 [Salix viminalis]
MQRLSSVNPGSETVVSTFAVAFITHFKPRHLPCLLTLKLDTSPFAVLEDGQRIRSCNEELFQDFMRPLFISLFPSTISLSSSPIGPGEKKEKDFTPTQTNSSISNTEEAPAFGASQDSRIDDNCLFEKIAHEVWGQLTLFISSVSRVMGTCGGVKMECQNIIFLSASPMSPATFKDLG